MHFNGLNGILNAALEEFSITLRFWGSKIQKSTSVRNFRTCTVRSLLESHYPEVTKLLLCSTELSTKFILLINVKNADNNCWHFNIN